MRAKHLILAAALVIVALALYIFPGTSQTIGGIFAASAPSLAQRAGETPHVPVVSAVATASDFPIRRQAIGFLSSPVVVDVNARIASQVTAAAVKDGQMVKAGDLLFSLDDRLLRAQLARDNATLAKDKALLASAEADLARAKDLAAKQAGTEQAYDAALATERAAAATVDADQAAVDADTVQLGFATISSPITGRLGAIATVVGDLVSASAGNSAAAASESGASGGGQPLVTVTQMDPLQVTFTLPESDLPLLQEQLAAPKEGAVVLRRSGDATPLAAGTLDFVDSSVDTASGTITARASVPNPGLKLWPGQYADITLEAGVMPQAVSVPTVAIQSGQKGPFVYVIRADATVEARQVTIALADGDRTALGAGVQAGEKVVVEGQARLKEGVKVTETTPAAATADAVSSGAVE